MPALDSYLVANEKSPTYGKYLDIKATEMSGNGITGSWLSSSQYNVTSTLGSSDYTSLISGYQWGELGQSIKISYSFPGLNNSTAYHDPIYSGLNEWSQWSALNGTQAANVRLAVAEFERISNVDFYEVAETSQQAGDIRFAFSGTLPASSWGHAYYPSDSAVGGDVWINDDEISHSFEKGSYDFMSILHEIGHALGLKHPQEASNLSPKVLGADVNNLDNTVMTYDRVGYSDLTGWPKTLRSLDDKALDTLYGYNPIGPSSGGGTSDASGALHASYRFYDTSTGDHFYTLSAAEKANIQATLPSYRYEGVGWATPAKGTDTIDVFRFFDTATSTHFFTTSGAERDQIISTLQNYRYEGVAFQAYANPTAAGSGGVTLERFYNQNTGLHHFAANAAEAYDINHGSAGPGWVDEGKAFTVHMPTDGMLLV